MTQAKPAGSFWTTLPGVLTGMSAVIVALTGAYVALVQVGVIGPSPPTPPPTAPIVSPTPTSPASISPDPTDPEGLVAVQNVYNLPEAWGMKIIADQGFTNVRIERVCSNSVTVGRIRQVLLQDGTELVGEGEPSGIKVPLSQRIRVKVSDGTSCP